MGEGTSDGTTKIPIIKKRVKKKSRGDYFASPLDIEEQEERCRDVAESPIKEKKNVEKDKRSR